MEDNVLYQEVANKMAARIEEMQQGERLPSVRALSQELNVSRSTVIAAYRVLEEAGLCYSRPRSGMFALPGRALLPQAPEQEAQPGLDLMSGVPGSDAFPFAMFKKAISDVLDADRENAFTYQPGCGYPGLREAIAAMMCNQSAPCKSENVLITSGAQQALDIAARLLVRPGTTVLMENPSYPGAQAVFAAQGARILGIPVGPEGMDLDLLEGFVRRTRPRLVYTMPLLQTPTTVCMPLKNMRRLCALAQEYDFYILEEDVVSELMDAPRPPIYALMPDRVIHIKSFSKIMMPGIRTGFLLARPELVAALDHIKRQSELSASGLIQRALCRCLSGPEQKSHINSLKEMFRARRAQVLPHLQQWAQWGVQCIPPNGGVDFWLMLPETLSDALVYSACRQRGVRVGAGSRYYCAPMVGAQRHLRVSVAGLVPESLETALQTMDDVFLELASRERGKLYIK